MPRRFFGRSEEDEVEKTELAEEQELEAVGEEIEGAEDNASEVAAEDEVVKPPKITELDIAQMEAAESKDKYIRLVAELENVKKRNAKERSELLRYAGEHIVQDLLLVLDNFQRALNAQTDATTADELFTGVKMIADEFSAVLEKHGVVGRDSVGQPFDPKIHEALAMIPTEDQPAGVVIEQLKKAYFMRDKLLRPAQVVVSANKPGVEDTAEAAESRAAAEAPEDEQD